MIINNSGSVGIGVTTPKARLHVNSNIISDGNITAAGNFVLSPDNSATEYWEISRTATGLNYACKDKVLQDVLFLGKDGNIGVGKTDPSAKLDVAGSFKAENATIADILTANVLNANNANISERLGIGVNGTPLTNMQIGALWTFQDVANTNNMGRNSYKNGADDVRIQSGYASRISFNNDGDILLQTAESGTAGSIIKAWNTVTFANNGNVGIGTTGTLSAKLEVAGKIKAESADITGALTANSATINGLLRAQSGKISGLLCAHEVRVMLSGAPCWPDYVFSKDYKLLPLKEVEQFITENQHLPNVPSSADVEANGVNVGEMNAILLQKVEELTLYIIDLQKQIDELKK
jgi:hypothetical protein